MRIKDIIKDFPPIYRKLKDPVCTLNCYHYYYFEIIFFIFKSHPQILAALESLVQNGLIYYSTEDQIKLITYQSDL